MNEFILKTGQVALALVSVIVLGGCGVNYSVEAANYGKSGVLLLDMPVTGGLLADGPNPTIRLNPGLPTVRDDRRWLGQFLDNTKSVPSENIEIVWQLANLENCDRVVTVRTEQLWDDIRKAGYSTKNSYSRKRGCTWVPIKGAIYKQKLDMQAIRESEAYKKAGKFNPNRALSRYTLGILLVFNEDQLSVETYNSSTNPWR